MTARPGCAWSASAAIHHHLFPVCRLAAAGGWLPAVERAPDAGGGVAGLGSSLSRRLASQADTSLPPLVELLSGFRKIVQPIVFAGILALRPAVWGQFCSAHPVLPGCAGECATANPANLRQVGQAVLPGCFLPACRMYPADRAANLWLPRCSGGRPPAELGCCSRPVARGGTAVLNAPYNTGRFRPLPGWVFHTWDNAHRP